jgi:hypothetical protein
MDASDLIKMLHRTLRGGGRPHMGLNHGPHLGQRSWCRVYKAEHMIAMEVSRDWGDRDGVDITDHPLADLGYRNWGGFCRGPASLLWFPAIAGHCVSGVIPQRLDSPQSDPSVWTDIEEEPVSCSVTVAPVDPDHSAVLATVESHDPGTESAGACRSVRRVA